MTSIKNKSEIPDGYYLILIVRKFSLKKSLLSIVFSLLPGGIPEIITNQWLLILDSKSILYAIDWDSAGFTASTKEWLENYRNGINEAKSQDELKDTFFYASPELLESKYGRLLNYKWIESCLVSIPN